MRAALIIISLLLAAVPAPLGAVDPSEMLDDPVLEARAREISKGLRCLVCQNQSIDDSDATLARDLRLLVRQRLTAGDTDDQVIDYVVSRYGDFVLLRPPLKSYTLVLWIGPAVILGVGIWGVAVYLRRRPLAATGPAQALSEEEEKRLEALIGDGDQ
ncbi:MAG: cytochrome c-type biogenesis protein [Rhodospirillales bacterium]